MALILGNGITQKIWSGWPVLGFEKVMLYLRDCLEGLRNFIKRL